MLCDRRKKDAFLRRGVLPQSPAYNINSDYRLNVERPPRIESASPLTNASLLKPARFCGLPLGFPIGLASSVLTSNAAWVEYYARKGYDLITYKTVRSRAEPPHPMPQWVPLRPCTQLIQEDLTSRRTLVRSSNFDFRSKPQTLAMANSFGIPSESPESWMKDVSLAKSLLGSHQALAVSVYGDELAEDFEGAVKAYAQTAGYASEAGADLIEANLSSPNIRDHDGKRTEYYRNPEQSLRIIRAIRETTLDSGRKIPILAKIGYLPKEDLWHFLDVLGTQLDGISAINTVAMEIQNPDGSDCFPPSIRGASRRIAGVSGAAIRSLAAEAISNIVNWRRKNRIGLSIAAIGGVMKPEDFAFLLRLGADLVECCTGAWLDDSLATKCRDYISDHGDD